MKYKKIDGFTRDWVQTIHCSKRQYTSRIQHTQVNYHPSPSVKDTNREYYTCDGMFAIYRYDDYPDETRLVTPHRLYSSYDGDTLIFQMDEDGHWFLLRDSYLCAGCSSCDGETSSRLSLYEAVDLHDLIFNCMDELERQSHDILILDDHSLDTFRDSHWDLESFLFE